MVYRNRIDNFEPHAIANFLLSFLKNRLIRKLSAIMRKPQSSQLANADYIPPWKEAIPLGIQHVLAMFAGNVTVPIIIASVAGLSSPDKILLIQAAMLVAGLATLMQTIGIGRVGARLPLVMGTSFSFIPIMLPVVKSAGLAAIFGATVISGIFHFLLGTVIAKARKLIPPLVSGIVVLSIGLSLIPVGIQYAAGGADMPTDFGSARHWLLACSVMIVIIVLKFFTKGFLALASVLLGLVAGYLAAWPMGLVDVQKIYDAGWFALPQPMRYGLQFNLTEVLGMCLLAIVSAIETVGDISGVTKGGANREPTDLEIGGGTMADGLGTVLAGFLGAMPNTSYSQNVGLVALTGVMSRHVVSIGALFLIIAALIPKIGAVVAVIPNAVIGGATIIMFGMVASAGLNILSAAQMTQRNMAIVAISLGIGLGLQAVPSSVQFMPATAQILLTSGLLPSAFLAMVLNRILPNPDLLEGVEVP
jgi:NCS2 family nucleobase:cation symporter-2